MFKVAISEFITDTAVNFLKENGYEIVQANASTKEEMLKLVHDCDALLVRIAPCDQEVIAEAKKLKVIAKHGVGTDNIDIKYATKNKIWVTFTPMANTNAVAEHALYLILACAKKGYLIEKHLRKTGDFAFKSNYIGCELEGKTLGLIGLGRIGQHLATKAMHGMGMKVIGYDPYIKKENLQEGIEFVENQDKIFEDSDFVSLHIPVTNETKGCIGKRQFKMMKESAFLINVARGELVIEKDIVEALKTGMIAGAGIDVFAQEPPKKDNELLRLENIVVTPHAAGNSKESMNKMGVHAALGIHEVLSGKIPTWHVNNI